MYRFAWNPLLEDLQDLKNHELRSKYPEGLEDGEGPLEEKGSFVCQENLDPKFPRMVLAVPCIGEVFRSGVMVHFQQVLLVETFVLPCQGEQISDP